MKSAIAFISSAVALRVSDVHPTVNMVLTNDGAMDANAFSSFAQQSKSKTLRADLMDLVKSEEGRTHASLVEDFHQPNVVRINYESPHASLVEDFHQPNVVRINYESPHANLLEGIVRESVSSDAPYEEGEIGLNLHPAGSSAASLKQLMEKTDADFETQFRAGLHASFLQGPAIRIRLPRGGLKQGSQSLISDDGRIAVRVLPARHIPGGLFMEHSSIADLGQRIAATGERAEAAIGELLGLFAQGRISKQELKQSGAVSRCAQVMQSEGASDAMRGGCGSVITHLTNTPVASSIMDSTTGGAGHVTVVLPSPSRVYGA